MCDISPFGIAAAHSAGIPAVLVENFTWDWIYTGYLDQEPGFEPFIAEFKRIFQSVDAHIQTQPVCEPSPAACLVTNPVARPPRIPKEQIRDRLQIPNSARLVLLSMGGFELAYDFLDRVSTDQEFWFVVPGGAPELTTRHHLVYLPHHSDYYHPDLVGASDAMVSKAGYSTISEVFYTGIPFGYVSRNAFRKSPVLSRFIQHHMAGFEIDGNTFQSGEWIRSIPGLLNLERIERNIPRGADQAANSSMKLIFARHGESEANLLHVFSNRDQPHPLTPLGREQAHRLADRLRMEPIARLFVSPVPRARQTAEILSARLGVPVTITDALREYDVGIYEGTSGPEGWQVYNEILADWVDHQRWDRGFEGGKSFNDMRRRFLPFIQELVTEFQETNDSILLVTHGGLLRCMLPLVLANIDFSFTMRNHIPNTATIQAEPADGRLICTDWCGIKMS